MTRPERPTDIIGNHDQHEKERIMKAEMEETTWLLDIAGKGSVKASLQVPVKGIKDESPAQEPVNKKYGKGERSCMLDGGNRNVQVKQRGDSWGMENFKGSRHHMDHPDPVEHNMEEKEKIPGGWNSQREANNT